MDQRRAVTEIILDKLKYINIFQNYRLDRNSQIGIIVRSCFLWIPVAEVAVEANLLAFQQPKGLVAS